MKAAIEMSITTLVIIIAVIAIVLLLVAAFQGGLDGILRSIKTIQATGDCEAAKNVDCKDGDSGKKLSNPALKEWESDIGFQCFCP